MTQNEIDLGSGYSCYWVGWRPDRELNPQYEGIPDIEKALLVIKCPHGEGGIHVYHEGMDKIFKGPFWTLVKEDPLTITPSIHRLSCDCHGHITEGKWVPA